MSVRKRTIAASFIGAGAPFSVPFFTGPLPLTADALSLGLALFSIVLLGYCLKLSRSLKKTSLERNAIFSNTPLPVFELDRGLKITRANRAAGEIAGCAEDGLAGKDFLALANGEDEKNLEEGLKAVLKGKETGRLISELTFNDDIPPVVFELTLLPSSNGGVTIMAREVGEVERLHDEMEQVKKEAEDASLKLKKTIKDLEEFALIAVRRERKMQEIRNHFIKPKDPQDRSA